MLRVISILFSLFTAFLAWSQKPYVEIFVEPSNVEVGEQFNVIVKSNISGEINIQLPSEFEQGYNVLNRMEQDYDGNTGEVITYFFHGRSGSLTEEGKFTFGPAFIKKGNKVYRSNKVTVRASEVNTDNTSFSLNLLRKPACGSIETSKDKVYVGEAFVVNCKVISQFKPTHYDSYRTYQFNPSADQHKLGEKDQPTVEYGLHKGKQRYIFNHDKQVVFLNSPGKVKIDPFRMTLQSGFEGYDVIAKKGVIKVLPLPEGAPKGFTGGVGLFEISTESDKNSVKEGDVITFTLIIKGYGNLHDINKPKIDFGNHFKIYGDPDVKEKFTYTNRGAEGEIRVIYHLQAVKEGDAALGKISLSYFDPNEEVYKTSTNVPAKLTIEKNPDFVVASSNQKESGSVKIERFNADDKNESVSFINSKAAKWIGISAPFCLAIFFLLFRKKNGSDEKSIENVLNEKELPTSPKRSSMEFLSVLQAHVNNGNELLFFTQLSKDLQICVSQAARDDADWVLSKEEKQHYFQTNHFSGEFQSKYFQLQQTCELSRYGCQKPEYEMSHYLEQAKEIFENLEG